MRGESKGARMHCLAAAVGCDSDVTDGEVLRRRIEEVEGKRRRKRERGGTKAKIALRRVPNAAPPGGNVSNACPLLWR